MRVPESLSTDRPLTLLLVAGEASGDGHGAELIASLRKQKPDVRIIGVGGPRMLGAGQEQLFDLTIHAVLGMVEVLRHYLTFRRLFHQVIDLVKIERPDAVVLIDNPGFNLRLANQLRREVPGLRIIYYVSPQVWAWKARRVEQMKRSIDLLLTILPFEEAWFARRAPKLKVRWVGHPLLDRILRPEGIEINPNLVILLPGSRKSEIEAHLPVLWEAARLMARERPELRFMLLSPSEKIQKHSLDLISRLGSANFDFESLIGYAVSHLSRAALALVASGTASLECALVGVPHVVIYKVHPFTYELGKRLVKVKHLSIINVMADEEVVPELLQDNFRPETVAREGLSLLADKERRAAITSRVEQVIATLGTSGASKRAAEAILIEALKAPVRS